VDASTNESQAIERKGHSHMFVASVRREDCGEREFVSIRVSDIVNHLGACSLYAKGNVLFDNARQLLPHGFLSHLLADPTSLMYRVPAEHYCADRMGEVQATLAATYGEQPLVDDTGDARMVWPPEAPGVPVVPDPIVAWIA
jgi:hypothetical protein